MRERVLHRRGVRAGPTYHDTFYKHACPRPPHRETAHCNNKSKKSDHVQLECLVGKLTLAGPGIYRRPQAR